MLYPLSYERWVAAAGIRPGWLTCRVYMVRGVGQQTDSPGAAGRGGQGVRGGRALRGWWKTGCGVGAAGDRLWALCAAGCVAWRGWWFSWRRCLVSNAVFVVGSTLSCPAASPRF